MKKIIQIAHFSLIGICTFLIILFIFNSDRDNDAISKYVEYGGYAAGVFWSISLFLIKIIKGETEDGKSTIIKIYRNLLLRTLFIIMTNFILLTAIVFFSYQLLFYRQVEFTSYKNNVTIYLDKDSGTCDPRLGKIAGGKPFKIRLPIGDQRIIYQFDEDERSEFIYIPSIWKKNSDIKFKLEFK